MAPRPEALIVDDDRESRDALAELLQARGYTVRQAENGRVAIDMIARQVPQLMLLDLEMPEMNGWDVLEWAHGEALDESMRVVVLSADASPPPHVRFVRKPCDLDALLAAVQPRA